MGLGKVATIVLLALPSWMHYFGETECNNERKYKAKKKFCQDNYHYQRVPVLYENCDIRHTRVLSVFICA